MQAVTVNMTTFLSTDTDSVSFTLVLYISQAQCSQDFVFNHHIKAVSLISVQDLQEQVLVLQSAGVLGLGRFTVDDPLPALLSE